MNALANDSRVIDSLEAITDSRKLHFVAIRRKFAKQTLNNDTCEKNGG